MNISMSVGFMDFLGFAVGIIGLLIALWQIISARKARQMYQEQCTTRCKDLVETVRQLDRAVMQACEIKDNHLDDLMSTKSNNPLAIRPLRQLSDQIHSIYVSKNALIRFCERLNDEHHAEFKRPVFEDIRTQFLELSSNQSNDFSQQHGQIMRSSRP